MTNKMTTSGRAELGERTAPAGQGASRAAPGKSGLHARGEGERVLALQSCPTLCDPIDGSQPGFPSLGFSRHSEGTPRRGTATPVHRPQRPAVPGESQGREAWLAAVYGVAQSQETPETPPSSRAEGLLFLHGLESNPGSSLQTEEEAGLP